MQGLKTMIIVLLSGVLTACIAATQNDESSTVTGSLAYLAKSDIDTVADLHLQESMKLVRELGAKLYRRNPAHCKRRGETIAQCIQRLDTDGGNWNESELGGRSGVETILLCFREDYQGDRVYALVAGLATMILASYNNRTEFYLIDELDPQKLYNSARNIEILVWRLGHRRDSAGRLYLLTNSLQNEAGIRNLSFERLFGKLIATQDMMARITVEQTNRRIKNVIQSIATAVFLPI